MDGCAMPHIGMSARSIIVLELQICAPVFFLTEQSALQLQSEGSRVSLW